MEFNIVPRGRAAKEEGNFNRESRGGDREKRRPEQAACPGIARELVRTPWRRGTLSLTGFSTGHQLLSHLPQNSFLAKYMFAQGRTRCIVAHYFAAVRGATPALFN